jgi:hypothetical protein
MPTPLDRIAKARSTIETGVLRTLRPWKDGGADTDTVHARARPETVRLVEHYFYEQEISRNPSNRGSAAPTGRIELTVPYDGHKYFTRQACADVTNALGAPPPTAAAEALVGHLLLAGYADTDLGDLLDLNDRYGSVPIRVPIPAAGDSAELDELQADRRTCVITYDYAPRRDRPRLVPIHVQADLLDPDSVDLPSIDGMTTDGGSLINDIARKITQQVSFRPHLLLRIVVRLDIPRRPGQKVRRPKVARMALDWPTITSLRALHLSIGEDDAPITYNPMAKSLEWSDVRMWAAQDSADGDVQTYRSADMFLWIEQPGELYQQESLDGVVEVEIPGQLLSGMEARLYDAVGARPSGRGPQLTSKVSTRLRLILDDAFARRTLSPWQQLHFDEVIPDEMRIADIVTALKDRGFELVTDEPIVRSETAARNDRAVRNGPAADTHVERFLRARKSEGPDIMELWLVVEGRRYQTERQNQVPGGHTYKSTFESGELKVYMRGTLPRDSRELTHEMNALQRALRERFDRQRARR